MCDWFENEEVDTFFLWEEDDKIENLDRYICNNVKTWGEKYIIKLLEDWEKLVMVDNVELEEENYDKIFLYLSTYIKLYVIEDLWTSFFDEFVEYFRKEGGNFRHNIITILSLLDYDDIQSLVNAIHKYGYSLYSRMVIIGDSGDDTSVNFLKKQIRNVMFLIKELLLVEHGDLIDIVSSSNYNLEKPHLIDGSNEECNLLNLTFLLPNHNFDDYSVNFDYLYKINRRFIKRYKKETLFYYGNICNTFSYRIKDFYNMSIRRDVKTDTFMLNFTNVMLKLWDDGRKLHHSRIVDINSKYLFSENSVLGNIISEATLCNSTYNTIDDMPDKFDFLTECFFITHRIINLTLYPIIKVYYKIHYKIIELKKSVEHYTSTYGDYENIPILERAIYNRLTNLIKHYVDKEKEIILIMKDEHIKKILPNLCIDTITILNKMRESDIMLYKMFPEGILDFLLEYQLFRTTAYKESLDIGIFAEFLVKSMSDPDRISNPYLRYKCFDIISINRPSTEFILSTVMCKKTILQNVISMYLTADKISTPHLMRDRINFFIIKALGFNNDYLYCLSQLKDQRSIIEFLYLEGSEMLYNFEIIMKNMKSIYSIRNLNGDESMSEIRERGVLRNDYKYKVLNSFIYLLNSLTICKILLSNSYNFNDLFYKPELINNFINFIHFVFFKSNEYRDILEFYTDFSLGDKTLLERFNNLYKISFFIYNKLSKCNLFLDIAEKTEAFFNKKIMIKYLENSLTLGLVNWITHDEIMETINSIHKKIEENSLDEREIPDELLDPIMSTLIEEPIMLPETDVIMDMNVISTHLLTNKTNPFTRTPLTLEELKSYNEREDVIKRVDEFRTKLIKWKEGN